jgi:hypothetical protein
MEWWILLALAAAVVVIGAWNRIRRLRRRRPDKEANNIYPLW